MSNTPQKRWVSVLVFLGVCLLVIQAVPAATPPKTVGVMDSMDALIMAGNKTYAREEICKALSGDKDVILAQSPVGSLDRYLSVLESKIQLGYLNGGFATPMVDVEYVANPEHILIVIEEGPRYTKGSVVIQGASDTLKNKLRNRAKITTPFFIPSCRHLQPLLTREILDIESLCLRFRSIGATESDNKLCDKCSSYLCAAPNQQSQ